MKPIAQTFYVNQPGTGVPGIYVTKVSVYLFYNFSPTPPLGIELQIRTTENGVPTNQRLPFASKVLHPYDLDETQVAGNYAIKSSTDASLETTFVFDTPVFLKSGASYAIVLCPIGDNPYYNVWTAETGQNNTPDGSPIYVNNDTGDLFLSSNDRTWVPNITEDMKFTIYHANFTSLSGNAVFHSPNEDYIELSEITGSFALGEPVYPTQNKYDNAVLSVSGINGTFANNDTVYQSNGSANVAFGIVYSSNSSVIKLTNTTASFSSSYKLYNANSVSNAVVTAVSQNASTTATTNILTVPDSSIFSTNDVIYIATNNYSKTEIRTVNSISNATSVVLSNTISFTDTNAIYGKMAYNGTLVGGVGAIVTYPDFTRMILDHVSSTTTNNFTSTVNQRIIGKISGASAKIHRIFDIPYNQMSPQITNMVVPNTGINWSFTGFKNENNYTPDASYININQGLSNEFIDKERILMSRSNELSNLPIGRVGDRSVKISASMNSANSLVTPVIDVLSKYSNFTFNLCHSSVALNGYYLNISNTNGSFVVGENITQGSSTATVAFANSSFIRIQNASTGDFLSGATVVGSTSSANAYVTTAEFFDETKNNPLYSSSRYISKNVILAAGQNSEDILVFLGAYRPANTNIIVFAKIQNASDPDTFTDKDWSLLNERSSPSLRSSQVNIDDQVELSYGFPQSQLISSNAVVCNTSSNTVSMPSTADLGYNSFIYISDDAQTKYIVRRVVSVVNSSAVAVDTIPSFTSSNAAVGSIPGLKSRTGAFLNDQNNNIVRYVTENDLVYDTYSQFAIKIVPVAASRALVPRVGDLRVLAIQA